MTFTVGDIGTVLRGTCTDGGTPVNLTGAEVEVHIQRPGNPVIIADAQVPNPATGGWEYAWEDGDLIRDGGHAVEVQVTLGDVVQTFGPASFNVRKQIA